ncbi:hypothetical protein ACFPJ1_43140 [Kribbella qitaiheensis]|uniref:hypothetical protein n=1 Tax=Kribbella qitaiheensis TaxID=1544730 RepID=UPI00361F90BB
MPMVCSSPAALWAHQADVLRAWHGDHPDDIAVAIELPTAAGKTLVAGLIAEYRRRKFHERSRTRSDPTTGQDSGLKSSGPLLWRAVRAALRLGDLNLALQ